MNVMPRFNSLVDWDAFQNGDKSKAVWKFILQDGKSVLNPDYDAAPYGLSLVTLDKISIKTIDLKPS